MSDCTYYQELISRLCDGQLNNEERDALAAHVRTCPECADMLKLFSELSVVLRDDLQEVPEGLHENIMASVRRSDMVRRNERRRARQIKGFLAAAACFAVVLVAAAGVIDSFSSKRTENVVSEAAYAREFTGETVLADAPVRNDPSSRIQASYTGKVTPAPAPEARTPSRQPVQDNVPEYDPFNGESTTGTAKKNDGPLRKIITLFTGGESTAVPKPTEAPVSSEESGMILMADGEEKTSDNVQTVMPTAAPAITPAPSAEPAAEPETAPVQEPAPEAEPQLTDSEEVSPEASPAEQEAAEAETPADVYETVAEPEQAAETEADEAPEELLPAEAGEYAAAESEDPSAETEAPAEELIPSPEPTATVTENISVSVKSKSFFTDLTDILTGKKNVTAPAVTAVPGESPAPAAEAAAETEPSAEPAAEPENTTAPEVTAAPDAKPSEEKTPAVKNKLLPPEDPDKRYEIELEVKGQKYTVSVEIYGEKLYCIVPKGLEHAGTWKASCSVKDFETFMAPYLPKVTPSPAPAEAPVITEAPAAE